MILEVATLQVKAGKAQQFELDFAEASKYIQSIDGYVEHTLQKCIEQSDKYILLVKWKTLDDHTIGFRESKEYLEWKRILHHYYVPFPIVEHYKMIYQNSSLT